MKPRNTKQLIENSKFNTEREERITEIQEVLESIYQESQSLLEEQQAIKSPKYMKKLCDTIKFVEVWLKKLKDPKDSFVNDKMNFKIVGSFKMAMKEIIGLLEILKRIEEQRQDLKHVNLQGVRQTSNPELHLEIKNSEKRLQRLRAGVKLTQVLYEQIDRRMKNFNLIRQQVNDHPQEPIMDRTAIHILEQLSNKQTIKIENKIPLIDVQVNFQAQKHKVEEMIKNYVRVEGYNNFDFSHKYDNLVNYFRERFKLANIQVGDDQINEFLRINRQNIEVLMMKEQKEALNQSKDQEKLYLKDLNPKNFIQDQDDQNVNTLKKILKVNQEIKRELMLEDHKDNITAINAFKIQEKQNYWERMLDQDTSLKTSAPKYINKRSLIKSQEFSIRPTLLSRPMTNDSKFQSVFKSQSMYKKPSVSSLKKKTIFYQAHPNFPLIKQVYQDTEYKLIEQEQRFKEQQITDWFCDGGETNTKQKSSFECGSTYDLSRFHLRSSEGQQTETNMMQEKGRKTLSKLWGETWMNYG